MREVLKTLSNGGQSFKALQAITEGCLKARTLIPENPKSQTLNPSASKEFLTEPLTESEGPPKPKP